MGRRESPMRPSAKAAARCRRLSMERAERARVAREERVRALAEEGAAGAAPYREGPFLHTHPTDGTVIE